VDVRVHGKHMQVAEDLRDLAERKVGAVGHTFADGAVADVEFAEHRNPRVVDEKYRVEITAPLSGHVVRVQASAPDERSALDIAADKFERVLRRHKERLIDRSRRGSAKQVLNDRSQAAEEDEDADALRIARVKQFAMKPMLPTEAALQMDMLDHNFYFFFNGETDQYSVLYRRRDGSLGLIEPQ
jgi:putative sigma-54 modulation protein